MSKNYERYVKVLNEIGNGNVKGKYFEFNGVGIESPITDESGMAWFNYKEACDYYGEENLKKVWTEKELAEMPWRDVK